MSIGSILKKIGKSPITRAIGKGIDFGSDFLPPGFRDVGNLGGKLLEGNNLKKAALGTAGDYLGGRIAKGIGSKLKGIGGDQLKSLLGSGNASKAADLIASGKFNPDNLSKVIKNADGSYADGGTGFDWGGAAKSALGGAAKAALGGITGGGSGGGGGFNLGGLGDLAKLGLGGLGAVEAAKTAAAADAYRKKGLQGVESEYAAAAPLRTMGLAGMTDPRMADVSSLFNRPRPTYRRI